MNKKIMLIVSIVLIGCGQKKTAWIDNAELINNYKEKKDIEAEIQKRIDLYVKKRDSLSVSFQRESVELSQEVQSKKITQAEMQKKYNSLMQRSQTIQEELLKEEQEIRQEGQVKMDSLISKVKKFVKQYGKEKGYNYIFGANEAGSVMWAKQEENITKEVLKQMNDKYEKK